MKTVEAYIDSKQQEFMSHPFFEVLTDMHTLKEISYFVPELTFWAMTFQDILRINEERVQDPYLKKIARHHRLEDSGHEQWFLQDKQYMAGFSKDEPVNQDSVSWLYSKEMQLTRDCAYAILSEVYKTGDEILNVILLLTLESTGHVFFEKVANQVKKTGEDKNLKYFSSTHLEVELAHAIFEEEMEKSLFSRKLPMNTKREALQLIDRCYDAFNKMFDGLLITCNRHIEIEKEKELKHAANTGHMDSVKEKAV